MTGVVKHRRWSFYIFLKKGADDLADDFESYLERYCKQYGVTPEEAKEHRLVQEVKEYYGKEEPECEP